MKKNVRDVFQIKAIELLGASLSPPDQPLQDKVVFQFDINIEHRIKPENKVLVAICNITIFSEKKERVYGHLRTSCIFEVEDLQDMLKGKGKQFNPSDQFLSELNAIALSTTRGMMFSQFRGTFLHSAVLPIVDPEVLKANV
jgi:hypothetical protein